jgi:hypothetical protein
LEAKRGVQGHARSAPALRMPRFPFRDSGLTLAVLAGTAAASAVVGYVVGVPELCSWAAATPHLVLPWAGGLAGLWLYYACMGRDDR